jgi:hypothetical protein
MWQNHTRIMHTTTTSLLPLFSFSFFFSHVGASLMFQKKQEDFLWMNFRKWGEICDLPAKCVFGKKSVGQWKMHTSCGLPRHPPHHHPSFFIALKTLKILPWKGTKSIFSCAQYMISSTLKLDEEKSVKICTVWFKKMVLAQHNYGVHHGSRERRKQHCICRKECNKFDMTAAAAQCVCLIGPSYYWLVQVVCY